MDAPLQSLMEDSCFYFLPGIRSKLIGGPSALKAVVAKALVRRKGGEGGWQWGWQCGWY